MERFWSKVVKAGPDDCWEWSACKDRDGYGDFRYGPDRGSKRVRAHRFAYELHHGSIPVGAHILHRCDNPPCVNPAHLFAGSNADNVSDKMAKGRGRWQIGTGHGNAKLTEDDVENIRALYPGHTLKFIAELFEISSASTSMIVNRHAWTHI